MTPNEMHLHGFTRALQVRNRSPRTIQSYLEAAGLLAAFLGAEDLAEVSRADVERFMVDQLARRKPASAAVRFRSLQQLYKWMVTEEIIDRSPLTGLRPPTVPEQPVPVVSDPDLIRLLRACDGKEFPERRDTAMIRLFVDTGVRVGEMVGMKLDDVDWRDDVIVVLGKGRRTRAVPFGPKTGQSLERYIRTRRQHPAARFPALWIGGRGQPMSESGIAQMLRRRAEQAGIGPLHPHQLRHTAAHAWFAADGSEGDAMRLFGWRSREMLARYGASAADERAREAHKRLGLGDRI